MIWAVIEPIHAVIFGGVDVDLGDRRARKNVVELIEAQQFPGLAESLGGIVSVGDDRCPGCQQFGIVEGGLAVAVGTLHVAVSRVRALVVFEVELPVPRR